MSKPRIMGAGLAGSTTVDVNVNGNQGGGSKKQGLPGYTNMRSSLVFSINQRAYGTPYSRDKVFYINQLSTIGAKSTMFAPTADGANKTNESDVDSIGSALYSQQQIQQLQDTLDYVIGSAMNEFIDLTNVYYDQMNSLSSSTQLTNELSIPSELDSYYTIRHDLDMTTFNSSTTPERLPMIVTILEYIIDMNSNISLLSDTHIKTISEALNSLPTTTTPLSLDTVLNFLETIKNNQNTLESYRSLIDHVIKLISYMQSHKLTLTSTSDESVKTAIINQFIGLLQNTTQSTSQTLGSSSPPVFTPGERGEDANTSFNMGIKYYLTEDANAKNYLTFFGYSLSSVGNFKNNPTQITYWNTVNVTDMSDAFGSTKNTKFNENIGSWNTSKVTDMENMFNGQILFNQDLSSWDVSRVRKMTKMFYGAHAFNQDISSWDVSKVTNMGNMFYNAHAFNQDISSWDVSKVTGMSNMFYNAHAFNQDISSWDVSNVTGMSNMFNSASAFNNGDTADNSSKPLNWNVSNVTNISNMFNGANAFNQDISSWDVSKVTNMSNMFNSASAFNNGDTAYNSSKPLKWNVNKVTGMGNMFNGAHAFNQDISSWNVKNVTNMNNMFNGANAFYQAINKWTVNPNVDLTNMFLDATAMFNTFNDTPGFGNTPTLEFFTQTFNPANNTDFNYGLLYYFDNTNDQAKTYLENAGYHLYLVGNHKGSNDDKKLISKWTTSSVTDMSNAFNSNTYSNRHNFNENINKWDTSSVTTMASMFNNASAFNKNIGNWNVSSVKTMVSMFNNASAFNQDISGWNVSNVLYMSNMFNGASAFNNGDTENISSKSLNNWHVNQVQNMTGMFNSASAFNQDLHEWRVHGAIDLSYMFYNATTFNGQVNNWFKKDSGHESKVTNMSHMFDGASAFNQPLDNWKTNLVTDMSYMFNGASAINTNIHNWNVQAVTNMSYMFQNATVFNQPINKWKINAINNMSSSDQTNALSNMFLDASAMQTQYGVGATPPVSFFGQ